MHAQAWSLCSPPCCPHDPCRIPGYVPSPGPSSTSHPSLCPIAHATQQLSNLSPILASFTHLAPCLSSTDLTHVVRPPNHLFCPDLLLIYVPHAGKMLWSYPQRGQIHIAGSSFWLVHPHNKDSSERPSCHACIASVPIPQPVHAHPTNVHPPASRCQLKNERLYNRCLHTPMVLSTCLHQPPDMPKPLSRFQEISSPSNDICPWLQNTTLQ